MIFSLLLFSCKSVCQLETVETILTIELGSDEGPDSVQYAHDVLLKDFSKECIYSASIVNLALRYMDTVKVG